VDEFASESSSSRPDALACSWRGAVKEGGPF
jgi:hypothetical protein